MNRSTLRRAAPRPGAATPAFRAPFGAGALGLPLLLLLAACGGGDATADAGPVVQDSAGVRILVNPAAGSWSADEAWTLEEDLRIGVETGDPELQFGNLVGVDASDDGRIVTLDQGAGRVRVFSAEGDLLHAFGRVGGGPGEISQAVQVTTGVLVDETGSVVVPDLGNARISRFSLGGEVLDAAPFDMAAVGIPILFARDADRQVVAQFRTLSVPGQPTMGEGNGADDRIVRMDPVTGDFLPLARVRAGETFSFGAGGMPSFMIFAPEPVWAVLGDGRVATGVNHEYSLSLHAASGSAEAPAAVESIVRRTVRSAPVTEGHKNEMRAVFRRSFEESGQPIPEEIVEQIVGSMEFAPTWPALAALLAGPDGTLWVQVVDAGRLDDLTPEALQSGAFGSRNWDVFDAGGGYLGVVQVPEGFTALRFVADALYGIHADDLGVQRVMRLRLVR